MKLTLHQAAVSSVILTITIAILQIHSTFSAAECYNTECDVGADALTKSLGVDTPQTCFPTDNGKRCFYTYIPECATKDSPLVYDIHGLNGCPLISTTYTGWKEVADEECMVVVWPLGNVKRKETFAPCFAFPGGVKDLKILPNRGALPCCCFENGPITENIPIPQLQLPLPIALPPLPILVDYKKTKDMEFLRSVASYVARDVPINTNGRVTIDTKRIYFGGHSNGAVAGHAMAMRHSDFVACSCTHAGSLITPPGEDYSPVPIWFIHGTADAIMDYNGGTIGPVMFFPSADSTFKRYIEMNGCESVNTEYITEGFIQRATDCVNNATVQFVSLYDIGHFPFPNPEFGFGNRNTTYQSTKEAYKFCSGYQKLEEPRLNPIIEQENSLLRVVKDVFLH